MGDKKSKALKKKLKAEAKLAKARTKYSIQKPVQIKQKWYKNPDWVRAIASIIAIILTVLGFLYFR